MDEATYQQWWGLHRRVAQGETLKPQEQEFYQAGVEWLDDEARFADQVDALREAQAVLRANRAEFERLKARRAQLEAEIAILEKRSAGGEN